MSMKNPLVFESIYKKLSNVEKVSIVEIKELLSESEFFDFKAYIRLFSKTVFKTYYDEMDTEKVKRIMFLRREIYIYEPIDDDEFKELIDYFESIEDYESCMRIKKSKNEYNQAR